MHLMRLFANVSYHAGRATLLYLSCVIQRHQAPPLCVVASRITWESCGIVVNRKHSADQQECQQVHKSTASLGPQHCDSGADKAAKVWRATCNRTLCQLAGLHQLLPALRGTELSAGMS